MANIPRIKKFMTRLPQGIPPDLPLADAEKKMIELGVRHLPVIEGNIVRGIVSDRDLKLFRGIATDEEFDELTVENVCQAEVYVVSPETPLDEVLGVMAEKKIGSAVVVDNLRLEGIFTLTDAVGAFRRMLLNRDFEGTA